MISIGNCVARAIDSQAQNVLLFRASAGAYDDHGRWQERVREERWIRAVVQPAQPRELEHLGEGRRTKGAIKLYTLEELKTVSEGESQPDRVLWYGEEYQVEQVWNWNGHYKVIATKVES